MVLSDYTKGFIIGAYEFGAKPLEIFESLQKYHLSASKTAIYDLINEFK